MADDHQSTEKAVELRFLEAIFPRNETSSSATKKERSPEEIERLRARIDQVLKTLSNREREIIMLRYGLGDGYTYTLEEVGGIMKVARERVRQLEAKAVGKLQKRADVKLPGFLD